MMTKATGKRIDFWKRLKRRLGDEKGAMLVEFALIVTLMVLILSGIVDYSLFVQSAFQMQEAAAAGAAYSAIPGNQDMSVAANQAATEYWTSYAQSGSITAVVNFSSTATNIWKCTPTGSTVAYSSLCTGYGNPVEYVQVTTQGTFQSVFIFPGFPSSLTLTGKAIYPVPWTTPAGG